MSDKPAFPDRMMIFRQERSISAAISILDDVICGRGMFGLEGDDDLKWAVSEVDKAHKLLSAVQPDAAAVWNAAIRAAADLIDKRHRGDLPDHIMSEDGNAIRGLIDKPAHVSETPKSEHDAANVLTPAERDRGFVMVMERAERAEAEVTRLTALLPHPGETAAEVMWRNHQRGVRLEELAKAAGVTRERARQMVRKAEMRMGDA